MAVSAAEMFHVDICILLHPSMELADICPEKTVAL